MEAGVLPARNRGEKIRGLNAQEPHRVPLGFRVMRQGMWWSLEGGKETDSALEHPARIAALLTP